MDGDIIHVTMSPNVCVETIMNSKWHRPCEILDELELVLRKMRSDAKEPMKSRRAHYLGDLAAVIGHGIGGR